MPEIQSNPEFYTPWPKFGKRLNFQWGELRQDIAVLKAVARAQVQDIETGDDFVNTDRILTGLEFGELVSNTESFKNKFRLFYNKVTNEFCIQYNSNTEADPTWVDYLCIDEATGMVTVNALTTSGILGNIFAYKHTQSTPAFEWVVNHNLNSASIIVQTFNTRDKVVQFDEADTSDVNTTYFYFVSPQAGTAVLVADHGAIAAIDVRESDGNPPTFVDATTLIFDSTDFYLSSTSTGKPTVSLRSAGATGPAGPPGASAVSVRESDGNPPTFSATDTLVFDSEFFYLSPTSTGKPTVSFRGTSGSSGISSISVKESDDNPTTFSTDTVIFNSSNFYLASNSVGKPTVNLRDFELIKELSPTLGANLDVNGFTITAKEDESVTIETTGTGNISVSTVEGDLDMVSTGAGQVTIGSTTGDLVFDSSSGDIFLNPGTGNLDVTSHPIKNVGAPTSPTDAARLADIGPGFYGIFVRESDGNPPTFKNDTLIFDSSYFYLHSNSVGKPTVSFRDAAVTSGGTDHGALTGLGDDDHPQYLLRAQESAFYGIFVRESDGNPPTFKNDTLIFDSSYFYLHSTSQGKPSVAIREDNLLRGHINNFDIHKHVSGFYAIRDPDDGFITRINWKNGDFNIVNRNVENIITSIVGKYYRKTFTRDDYDRIIDVTYTGI